MTGGHRIEYMDRMPTSTPVTPSASVPPQTIAEADAKTAYGGSGCDAVADHFNIIGGATIRFAYRSDVNQPLILAVHPRYTRTSALVSRAYGIAIGRVSALLAAGVTWSQLPASYAISLPLETGIVAVKWPCWDFERLEAETDLLGPQMQAIGQALALGRSFKDTLRKASCAADIKRYNSSDDLEISAMPNDHLQSLLASPSSRRPALICEALRRGISVGDLAQTTQIKKEFIQQFIYLTEEAYRY